MKRCNSRLAKPEKPEFTNVNEDFEGKRNAEVRFLFSSLNKKNVQNPITTFCSTL